MSTTTRADPRICLLGFGEVGQTLAADLLKRGVREVSAWDIQFPDSASIPSRAIAATQLRAGKSAADAVAGAHLVLSAVTAAQDVDAARTVAPHLPRTTVFVDLNSASPGMKQQAAQVIEDAGGRYVEAAVMSPIGPKGIASPMLLGGPHAAAFLPLAQALGFNGAAFFSNELGRASAAKMCRSVMIKGMETLLTESLLTARHYGVEETVIDSLQNLLPAEDWRKLARYMISRSLIHGRRRAEEMREVARTVSEAGLDPTMSSASAQRQDWAAQFRDIAEEEDLYAMLDSLLGAADCGDGRSR